MRSEAQQACVTIPVEGSVAEQLLLQQAAFSKQQDKIASKFGFEITDHSLYLYGICQACQKS